MRATYLVLAPGTDPAVVRDDLEEIWDELARRGGPLLAYDHTDEAGPTVIDHWRDPRDDQHQVRLAEDRRLDTLHLEVEAVEPSIARKTVEALTERLPVVSFASLRDLAVAATEPSALVRMALASPSEPDQAAVAAIGRGLDGDAETREAAVTAAALTGWPDLARGLDAALATEDDPGLRAMIQAATAALGGDTR